MADLQVGGSAPSDTDRSDIRAGLGLGDSATRSVGTTAGTVAAGDDSRLSNARTPTAHASSHAAGEADAITPASIGAAPAGTPSAFTSRTLTDADDGDTLVCATAQTATVNTGLRSGFGCSFKGAVSFSGTATVTDVRTTGAANPWCALVQTGTDTYDAVGGKA